MTRPGFEADRFRIVLRDARRRPGARARRGLGPLGRRAHLLARTARRSTPRPMTSARPALRHRRRERQGDASWSAEGHVHELRSCAAATASSSASTTCVARVELYTVAPDGASRAQITDVNQEALAAHRASGEPEQFDFTGAERRHGVRLGRQAGRTSSRARSTRSPSSSTAARRARFSNEFHYRWNPQVYAGAGYAVVTVDFHGSTGYGQAFTDAIRERLGRQAARRPAEGAGGGPQALPLDRRRPRVRARRLLRRLHDQLDRRQLARPLPVPGHPRRHLRPAA